MSYVTPADMIELFETQELVEATNLRNAAATTVNEVKLQAACDGAIGVIDGWLMRRYTLPIADIPDHLQRTLKIHAANIARNLLDGSTEEVRKKAEDAIDWLRWFSDNEAIGDLNPGVTVSEKAGSINYEMPDPTWTSDRLAGLI